MPWAFDPHPFVRCGTTTICVISLMHIVQAIVLVLSPTSGNASAILAMLVTFRAVTGQPHHIGYVVAAFMVGAALSAVAGALYRIGRVRLAMFAPQQFLLFVMALGGMVAASNGAYLDGTTVHWTHIFNDQLGLVALFAIHWNATVRRARDPDG